MPNILIVGTVYAFVLGAFILAVAEGGPNEGHMWPFVISIWSFGLLFLAIGLCEARRIKKKERG